ncbi:lipocalin-like domain-containing protein [Ulvibacter antarcticus]|uniref:Lipocalin-like domain-containing protein n=1 Tax=Ulvibacter antarcticus TaxID=442714 RepID=A0A3L9YGD8_9FLAO|nr:lipocalin family protein [Ulvibacter antarcticus]RMA57175.1 hypothetical protein BXY75_3062 [Ulvibacter antarcticus]
MKTLRILTLVILTIAISSCSKNDDTVVVEEVVELTTAQLLTSGPWYVEGISGSTLDECDKQTNFNFGDDGFMILERYFTNAGVCELDGSQAFNYTLSDMLIILENGGSGIVLTIDHISESQLLLIIGSGGGAETYILRK